MKQPTLRFAVPAASLALAACFSSSPSSLKDPEIPGDQVGATSYAIQADRIIVEFPEESFSWCVGNEIQQDTRPAVRDTSGFELEGNALRIYFRVDSSEFMDAIVRRNESFERVGSGNGLKGVWRLEQFNYEVVSGALAPDEKSRLDSELADIRKRFATLTGHIRLSDDSMFVYTERNTARIMQEAWTQGGGFDNPEPESTGYDIDFRILDSHTVEYHGRVTGETVKVTQSNQGDVTYRSDDPKHAEYRFLQNPTDCPDDEQPAWYIEFQYANQKVAAALPKRADSREIRPFRWFFGLHL